MKRSTKFLIGGSMCAIALVAAFSTILSHTPEQRCVSVRPNVFTAEVGFELINILQRQAWVSTDWTLADYSAFLPGWTSKHWLKNQPRQGSAARSRMMKSPACGNDGEFAYRTLFDRTFFHVADIVSIGPKHGRHGEIAEGTVLKFHRLEFEVGQAVTLLVSPQGDSFLLVNRPVGVPNTLPSVSDGWSISTLTLEAPWRADLFGHVRVLRLEDGSSFQGPIALLPGS